MPKSIEVACRNGYCDVDMFSIHYESYIQGEEFEADYACPGCAEQDPLESSTA